MKSSRVKIISARWGVWTESAWSQSLASRRLADWPLLLSAPLATMLLLWGLLARFIIREKWCIAVGARPGVSL